MLPAGDRRRDPSRGAGTIQGILRGLTIVLAILAVTVWLFADTVVRYRGNSLDSHTIRFAHFGSYQDYRLWRRIIDAFERTHPGLHVRQEFAPGWYGQYEAKLRRQILSDTLPHVVLMQLGPFTGLADHFAALDPLIRAGAEPGSRATVQRPHIEPSAFDPTALAAFRAPGKNSRPAELRGLPVAGGTLLIYCNPECFAAASAFHGEEIPLPADDWTMTDFQALARRLTCDFDGDGQLDQFGFWLPRWVYYLPFLWSHGAKVVDETQTRWELTGPEAENAFTFYRALARDRRVCPKPSEVPQLIQDLGFLTGKVAMCVNGPWFEPFLTETRLRDSYYVATIPSGPGGRATRVTWDGLCIAGHLSETEKRRAWQFVRFCVSEPAQDMIAETGRALPALVSSMPAFDRAATDSRRRKFVEALAYARLQPRTPNFTAIDRAVQRRLQRFIADDSTLTPTQFLSDLRREPAVVQTYIVDGDRRR